MTYFAWAIGPIEYTAVPPGVYVTIVGGIVVLADIIRRKASKKS